VLDTHVTHAPKNAHAHAHVDTHMTRTGESTPHHARQPGKRGDGGDCEQERERRAMGHSESISAHRVITNMGKCVVVNMHDKQGKYMRNQSTLCMAHAFIHAAALCISYNSACHGSTIAPTRGEARMHPNRPTCTLTLMGLPIRLTFY